ncbi:hypothetical protein HA402_014199 [Bradysia odoriphaga]|nr:hypothetical protein HA402_014199 [Bradysia odoriphaga]
MSVHQSHCDNCVKLNCDDDSCKFIDCRQAGCEFRMHECKQQDHLDSICSRVRVPCINSESGCTFLVLRHDLRTHLERCPASAVSCSFVNNNRIRTDNCCRWRLESKFKDHFKQHVVRDDSTLSSHVNEERPSGELKPKQVCGSDFRRDEYCSHYQNLHCDIMPSLNGWMEKFCPNQQYGCTFSTKRIQPTSNNKRTQIVFSKQNKAFGHLVSALATEQSTHDDDVNLTQLPPEIISHILSYLDAFSLNNISLTNKLLRSLSCDLLERKGLVTLIWKRGVEGSRMQWVIAGYRWKFSNHFSLIKKWELVEEPFLNHFANECKHFDKLIHKEPFRLIDISVKEEENAFFVLD